MSDLEKLYKLAKTGKLTEGDRAEQRSSFVYGSTKIENDRITRELVDEVASKLSASARNG